MEPIKLKLDIFPSYSVLEGKVIHKPYYIAPSEWLQFWEDVNKLNTEGGYVETRSDCPD